MSSRRSAPAANARAATTPAEPDANLLRMCSGFIRMEAQWRSSSVDGDPPDPPQAYRD